MLTNRSGQSQSFSDTPSLVRVILLGHSVMARCHHYHETVLQLLHLNAQIGALFTRDCSGEPLMSSSVKEELAFPNLVKKSLWRMLVAGLRNRKI
jgi:hypothetical protein